MPHGSLLGLLLFDLYTNDIFEVSSDANVVIYAGDTSIFWQQGCESSFSYLICYLKKNNNCSKPGGINFNDSKTKVKSTKLGKEDKLGI